MPPLHLARPCWTWKTPEVFEGLKRRLEVCLTLRTEIGAVKPGPRAIGALLVLRWRSGAAAPSVARQRVESRSSAAPAPAQWPTPDPSCPRSAASSRHAGSRELRPGLFHSLGEE